MPERKRLGEILVQLQVITPLDVDRVLDTLARCPNRRKKFGQMAHDMGLIDEEHILAALAVQMNLLPNIENLTLAEVLGQLLAADRTNGCSLSQTAEDAEQRREKTERRKKIRQEK